MKLKYFLMAIVLSFQSFILPALAENEIIFTENANVIGSFNFEKGSDEPALVTNGSTKQVGGDYKNVLEFSTESGSGASYFLFDKTVNSGKVYIGYDVYSAQKNKESYIRMLEGPYTTTTGEASGHFFEGYIIRGSGVFQMFNNTSWDVDGTPTTPYEANRWYRVELWCDFDNRTVSYYIDGEILGTTSMAENFDELRGFVHSISNGGTWMIDNVYAVEFTGGGNDMSKYPYIKAYPETVEQKIMTEVKISKGGHAFFGKNVDFNVKVTEGINQDFKGKLRVTLFGEDGKATISEKELSLNSGEEKEVEFKIEVPRYGYFDVVAECIREDGQNFGKTSTRLTSVVPAGKMNPLMGICDHVSKNYGSSKDKYLMAKDAGINSIRDEIRWTEFEKVEGVFEPDVHTKRYLDFTNETGQRKFAILGYYMPGRTQKGLPRTPADMAKFKVYVENVLRQTKDMEIDFELWNEHNMHVGDEQGQIEDYVNLAKLVYPLVKEINPDAKLYVLATANVATAREYIEECFKLGIGDYCDGFSIHPYNVALQPESDEAKADVYDIVAMIEKYGLSHKELVFSEYGWTSSVNYISDETQAYYTVRGACEYQDVVDRIYWYNLQEKTTGTMSDAELHFGMIRGWQNVEIPYEPKPVFLALSNYNRLMTGSKKVGEISHSNENVHINLFNNEKGTNTIVAWAQEGNIRTALDTGLEKVTLCDLYGNETVISTNNGVVDLTLTPEPLYITGSNLNNAKEAEPTFNIMQDEVIAVEEDTAFINGYVGDKNSKIRVICPDNIEVSKISEIGKDGSFRVDLKTGSEGKDKEFIELDILDADGKETVYTKKIPVIYKKAVSVESSFKYYKNSHWQLVLKIKNNKRSGTVSGKTVITEPSGMSLSKAESEFNNLIPDGTRYVYVNVPLEKSKDELTMRGYVEISTGERIEFNESSYFVGLAHLEKKPVIDGKIDKNEYVTLAPVRADKEDMVKQITDWGGKNDLSATIYLNYDKDYFYIAARVTDNIEGATEDAAKVWANDSIQFAFAEKQLITAGRTEIGIGKDKDGNPTIQRYSFLGTKFFAAGIDEAIAFDETCELKMSREGNDTIYELRMPWIDIYGDASPKFTRRNALFSIIVNDNDGEGRRGWMEFCPGIGSQKNAAQFMKISAM